MILVVGANGRLVRTIAELLLEEGLPVRLLARQPAQLADLAARGAEVVRGDIRLRGSLELAMNGATRVFTTVHAFHSQGDNDVRSVDVVGNRDLINCARVFGIEQFVFTSVAGARADHPIDFFRAKYAAEEQLRQSGMGWTILRPTAFMEFWASLVGEPILATGRTRIFGRGHTPVNLVSVKDVARFALAALTDSRARNRVLEIGGPDNLTMEQVAEVFERLAGRKAHISHVPLPLMRVMALALRPFDPGMARQIAAGVMMDTSDGSLDASALAREFGIALTSLEQMARGLAPVAVPV